MERLGITDEIKPKTILHANARAAGVLIVNGEAEIGVNLIQELMSLPGIEVVGPLPPDLQNTVIFAAAIMSGVTDATAAKGNVEY